MDYQVIIDKIRAKDSSCLELLYKAFGQQFFGYCVHKWKLGEDEAWEVVYQTLETIIKKGGQYDFESSAHFKNFLFKVLINFLRQHYRKMQNSKMIVSIIDMNDEELPLQVSEKLTEQAFTDYYNEAPLDNNLGLVAIRKALDKLSNIDRDLLLLKAQNYTYEEISHMLFIDNNQLKVKHHRAKQKLINLLKGTDSHDHNQPDKQA